MAEKLKVAHDVDVVCKSNALIEASYRLTLYEQRVVLAAISQVRRDQKVTDEEIYVIRAAEFAAANGIDVNSAYRHLHDAVQRLYQRQVTVFERPNGGGALKPRRGLKGRSFRWIQTIDFDLPNGMVGIRFGKDILPYLSQLSERYTRYLLKDVGGMSSVYAIRLYELLVQWKSRGTRTVSIEWLRRTFALGDKYQAINDFKKVVIRQAVAQINDHSPLYVEWDQIKSGRRITHFVFRFEKQEDRRLRLEQEQQEQAAAEAKAAAEEKKRLERAEAEAAREALRQKREAMKKKKPWEDAEHPILPGEEKEDYFQRIAKIRGLDQPKPAVATTTDTVATATDTDTVVVATATDTAATDTAAVATPRCKRTTDMFEAFNEGESK